MSTAALEWLVATIVVALCAGAAVFGAVSGRVGLSLPSIIPIAAGLFIRTTGAAITPPAHGWIVALSIAVVTLAVVSGGPLVIWVLRLTDRGSSATTNTLRGGATIGYLERIAVVGAVGLGQVDIVVAVIAIKGLGRFTELDTSQARERFIIGTLLSLLWSGLAAGLVWPPR
jgi:hypothetical protein